MRRLILCVLFILLLTAEARGAAPVMPTPWQEFITTADGFAVLLPGQPRRYADPRAEPPTTVYLVEETDQSGYLLFVSNVSETALSEQGPEALLDAARDRLVAAMHAQLRSEHSMMLAGQHGCELLLERPEQQMQFRARLFVVKSRLYELVAYGPPMAVQGPEIARFFDSFRLLENPP